MSWRNPWLVAGACLAVCSLLGVEAAGEKPTRALLESADSLRRSDPIEMDRLLDDLEKNQKLSEVERLRVDYLRGWQLIYLGKPEAAAVRLRQVAANSRDPLLQFRAKVSIVNALTLSGRYQEGYEQLADVVANLPQVRNGDARDQALSIASYLYTAAGAHDMGLAYADRLIAEGPMPESTCVGLQLRLDARHRMKQLGSDDPDFAKGVAACARSGQPIHTSLIRLHRARQLLAEGAAVEAKTELLGARPEAAETGFDHLLSDMDSVLAGAALKNGDFELAKEAAHRAISALPVDSAALPLAAAYRVLYEAARLAGNSGEALAMHEKYVAADRSFVSEAGARAMAFQAVKQQVQDKKQQIETLSKQNELLQLEQKVAGSAVQTRGLYILLLLSVLAFIAMWLFNTKRSQIHFMKLARRDGLTGIFNRAHFADAAEAILAYCRKGGREACMVLIDLDNFKLVNDTHGHAAGDTVLRRTVQACQAHLRSIDIIGRLGGEEFGIVMPDLTPEQAAELADRFRLAIADLSNARTGVGFPVSASFGVTSSRWSGYSLKQLLIHADKTLYAAKDRGRNRVEIFDPASVPPEELAAPAAGSFDRRRE